MYRFADIFSLRGEISSLFHKFSYYSFTNSFHEGTKTRVYLLRSRNEIRKACSREGEKKDHRVSTLAHLQIRSMNEHVYVHTNDVVVAALLSIARCNRTGNKLDPLVEEHHRAFLLNSRKRRNMRRVFVAFRVTVAAWHIPPDGKVSVVTNAYQPRGCGGCKCSRLLERHVPKVLYFVCNRFFQYGEHSGWLDWMGVCNKRSDARCMTTRFLYARVHGWP